MLEEPLVSIIILNWNGYEVTRECLLSLLSNQYQNYNVILVDNGSVDGSVHKLNSEFKQGKVEILALDKNYGFTGGNNRGINYAQNKHNPKYYLMLNNDTIVQQDFLVRMLESISLNPKCYAVVPKIYYMAPPNTLWFAGGEVSSLTGIVKQYGFMKQDDGRYNSQRSINYMNGCCALISRDAIEEIGLLDEIFFANTEDVDYGIRILKSNHDIIYNPEAVIYHKVNYSFKSNRGKWFAFYLTARNKIILHQKHKSNFETPLFILIFGLRWVLYLTIKLSFLGDFRSVKAIYQGLYDGFTKQLRFISK